MKDYCLEKRISLKRISLIATGLIFLFNSYAQCPDNETIAANTINILNNKSVTDIKKLQELYDLKKRADACKLTQDSIYARLLDRIALFEYTVNKNYTASILLESGSIKINAAAQKNRSRISLINSYFNLGFYYTQVMQYNNAVNNFDSSIMIAETFPNTTENVLSAKLYKAYVYFTGGDYEKSIEESTRGIMYGLKNNDSSNYISFLVQRSQSLLYQNRLEESLSDVAIVINNPGNTNKLYNLASALKNKALVSEKKGDCASAELYFNQSLQIRIKTNIFSQIAGDYNDLGNFYLNCLNNYTQAKKNYFKVIEYAKRDNNNVKLAQAYTNLGEASFREHKYKEAREYYIKVLDILNAGNITDILKNPPASFINLIGNKDLITVLLVNKTELLLQLFKETKDDIYIKAALETALITDSVISQTRHEQSGEQSKLYWRNKTRDFFTKAIEVCYITKDTKHAFYFIEKSRAVLLNDKLNELSASFRLPQSEARKEQELQIKIITEQLKLSRLKINTVEYEKQYNLVIDAKENLDEFIKPLYKKYPTYYQYKYADAVPALDSLQTYLGRTHQSFVHYFTNDTVAYILSITAGNAKILKLTNKDFNQQQINGFANFCSNKDSLNSYYGAFSTLSNTLYKTLFQPLQLPKGGRVIICSDNFLIPFEALCSDAKGKDFLIYNYTFSYAYSATYLLKRFTDFPGKGNFVGFAPVSFQKYLDVPDLKNSATALTKSANEYSNDLLFVNTEATKNNFLQHIGNYTIANVFSHASADSSETEPRLYMQDSTINLSELQLLDNKPATKLVVLSACQTNVGKNATGEGIYSLARGFTAAGIPSIAATLWNADEDMIYEISAGFHKYLSQGMSKDSALQKAKIDFIKNNDKEKELPYYWANMILIGNTEPLQLTSSNIGWWWVTGATVIILAIVTLVAIRKRRQRNAQ